MSQTASDILTAPQATDTAGKALLRWLLVGYLVCMPIQIETPFDIRFAPSDLFLLPALLLGLRVWRIGGPAWSPWHVGLLGLFLVWTLAKILVTGSVTQYILLNKMGGIVLLFAFYVCFTSLTDSWEDLRWFLKAFVLSVVVLNTASAAAFLWCGYTGSTNPLFQFLISGGVDRLAGMLVDPNAYGGLLTVAYAILLLDGDSERPLLSRCLRLLGLVSLSAGLMLTSSRSAWIGFAVLTLVGAARNPRLLLLVLVMAAVGVAAVAYSAGEEGFESLLATSSRRDTIDERLEINRNALQMFLEHPGFGAGIGSYYEEYDIIVHNSALWFLAEFGAVGGFTAFAGFALWFLVTGVQVYRRVGAGRQPLVVGLVAAHLAMMGFSLGVEAFYQRYWWLVLAALGSAATVAGSARRLATVVARSPDRATGPTAGLPLLPETCGHKPWHGQETVPQQAASPRRTLL